MQWTPQGETMALGLQNVVRNYIEEKESNSEQSQGDSDEGSSAANNVSRGYYSFWEPFLVELDGLTDEMVKKRNESVGAIIKEFFEQQEPTTIEKEFENMEHDFRFEFLNASLISYEDYKDTIVYIRNTVPEKWGIGERLTKDAGENKLRCTEHGTLVEHQTVSVTKSHSQEKIEEISSKDTGKIGDTSWSPGSVETSTSSGSSESSQQGDQKEKNLSYRSCISGAASCRVNKQSFVSDGTDFIGTSFSPMGVDERFSQRKT
jgi:hypothetical protein